MKNLIRIFSTAALALVLTAGAASAQSHQHEKHEGHGAMQHGAMHQGGDVLQPRLIAGVQVVELEVGKMGYSADKIALAAGVPARLVFTRTEEGGCTHQVQIPAFGVEATDLPLNEPVAIEFTPEEAGTFTFACGMDMIQGSLLVRS